MFAERGKETWMGFKSRGTERGRMEEGMRVRFSVREREEMEGEKTGDETKRNGERSSSNSHLIDEEVFRLVY